MATVGGSGKGIQIVVGADYNDRDLKRAQNDLNRLRAQAAKSQGPMRQLGGTLSGMLGPAFAMAGAAAAAFAVKLAIDGVQAAIEEEKSVARLKQGLDNLNMGFAMPYLSDYIDKTQRATGVSDDELRPALQQLAGATGNLYQAQRLLSIAMDVSAGSGKDLSSVTAALSKAAGGQFTAIKRLVPGINSAAIASGDLNQVTAELSRLFGGQAKARAETFAGTMDRLSIAAQELLEAFGDGFLTAFKEGLGGADDFMKTLKDLEPQLRSIGSTIGGVAGTIASMSGAIELLGRYIQVAIVGNTGWIQFLADKFGLAQDRLGYLSDDARDMADVMSGTVSSGIQQATDDMTKLERTAEDTAQYFEDLNTELKIFSDLTSENDAVRSYQEALDDLRKSVKENGKAFGDNTDAQRANSEALDGIFNAAVKVAEGQQTAAEKIATMESASRDANAVLQKMGVPPDVRASLLAPFDDLIWKFRENNTLAANLKQRMEELPTGTRTFTYVIDYQSTGKPKVYEADGGHIPGAGHARGSDTVPAMLTPGEFVIRRQAVKRFGADFFSQLNRGINPLAGMTPAVGGRGGGLNVGTINVTSAAGERAETSLPRALRRMAFLAGMNG